MPVVFEADKESSSRTGKRRANRRRGTRCHRCVVRCFGEMRTKKNLAGVSRRLRGQPSIFSTLVRRNPAVPSLSSVPLRDEWYRSRPRKVFQKLPRMLRGLATGGKKIQTSRLEFFKSLKKSYNEFLLYASRIFMHTRHHSATRAEASSRTKRESELKRRKRKGIQSQSAATAGMAR